MKIIVVGTGFVGLPHAAICAEHGHDVYAYDIDERKLEAYRSGDRERIEGYVNEPGLVSAIHETMGQYLFFTSNLTEIIEGIDVIFMCLPTPPKLDGSTDLSYYTSAGHTIAGLLAQRTNKKRCVIVNKSTVPIGTARYLQSILEEHGADNVGVASNPEFLPQGNAVEASRKPDRVVLGADTLEDFKILRRVYSQYTNHVRIRYLETTPETAEATKYIANTLLLTYISFWNGVGARLSEAIPNIRMEDMKIGVTADSRVSTWGSYVSNGAGGSCFGKDIQSLIYQLNQQGANTDLLQSVYNINEYQKTYLLDRAVHEAKFNFNQKTVALLGLAFKKRTNDMRDSAALKAVETLLARGVKEIRAYDPLAMEDAKRLWFNPDTNHLFDRITYHDSVDEALAGSDACYISTDWEEFRGLAQTIMEQVQAPYLVIDGRRMIPDFEVLVEAGFDFLPVGGAFLEGKMPASTPQNGTHVKLATKEAV
jgi:UDPglucose 6-dehydrogenase